MRSIKDSITPTTNAFGQKGAFISPLQVWKKFFLPAVQDGELPLSVSEIAIRISFPLKDDAGPISLTPKDMLADVAPTLLKMMGSVITTDERTAWLAAKAMAMDVTQVPHPSMGRDIAYLQSKVVNENGISGKCPLCGDFEGERTYVASRTHTHTCPHARSCSPPPPRARTHTRAHTHTHTHNALALALTLPSLSHTQTRVPTLGAA